MRAIRSWFMPGEVFLSWRQLIYERKQFISAICGIAFVVTIILFQKSAYHALFGGVTAMYRQFDADLVLFSPNFLNVAHPSSFPEERLALAAAHPQVERLGKVCQELATWRNPVTRQEVDITFWGVEPTEKPFRPGALADGLSALKVLDGVLYDAASEVRLGPLRELTQSGAPFYGELNGKRVRLCEPFLLGSSVASNGNFVTSLIYMRILSSRDLEGRLSIGLVKLKPGSNPQTAAAEIARTLPADVTVLTLPDFIHREDRYWDDFTAIGFIIPASLFVSIVVGAAVIYQILYTNVSDHLREYATLKAIGFPHRALARVILQQAMIFSLLGYPPGVVLAHLLMWFGKWTTGLTFILPRSELMIAFFLTCLMGFASGLLALRRLQQANPADVFA